jgi:hypothetical protein
VQTYHEKSSPYYPDDPLLQSLLISDLAANPVPGQVTTYSGQTQTGFAGGGHARVDYRVAPNLHIGANVSIDHSGDYTEGTGLLYARYLFNGTRSQ